MMVFQSKLLVKNKTLPHSSTTACCNFKGKAQYIKMVTNGWHQLVQLYSTISNTKFRTGYEGCHINTLCVCCNAQPWWSQRWQKEWFHLSFQQPTGGREATIDTFRKLRESWRLQWYCTAHVKVSCRRDFPGDGGSTFLCHTIMYLMAILMSKINDGGGKGQKVS